MPRFDVSVSERDPDPTQADRAQKCKCKCKCDCIAPVPGPWSRVPAELSPTAATPRFTELSPLGD
jgi:hypothetical protein